LYADIAGDREVALLKQVLLFAYVMGGFGKSWRRVWHGLFLPDYHRDKFAIGCHWVSSDLDEIQTPQQLKTFLDGLRTQCCDYLKIAPRNATSANWREAWSPERVAVFGRVGMSSEAIRLFHREDFKTTPAIGGRKPHRDHPQKFNPPENTSSVWHRMLPLKNGTEYLEIVTVFYGDRSPWQRDGEDKLQLFIAALQEQELSLVWGELPEILKVKKRIG
jgi:CRISPR-associated protein Cmr6